MSQKNRHSSEFGGIFIYIFIGIALFALLAFTFSRGQQGVSTSILTSGQAKAAASEIIAYSNSVEQAVQKLIRNGCSEGQISFERENSTDYDNGTAPLDNSCHIFHSNGGRLSWKTPSQKYNDASEWMITDMRVGNYAGDKNLGSSNSELVMVLPNLKPEICDSINSAVGAPPVWESNGAINTYLFVGDFETSPATSINNNAQFPVPSAGCFCDDPTDCSDLGAPRYYYKVLLVR